MAIQIDNSTLTQLFVTEDKKEIVTPMSKGTLAVVEVAESHSLRLIVGSSAFELKKDCPLKNYNDQPLSCGFPLAANNTLNSMNKSARRHLQSSVGRHRNTSTWNGHIHQARSTSISRRRRLCRSSTEERFRRTAPQIQPFD